MNTPGYIQGIILLNVGWLYCWLYKWGHWSDSYSSYRCTTRPSVWSAVPGLSISHSPCKPSPALSGVSNTTLFFFRPVLPFFLPTWIITLVCSIITVMKLLSNSGPVFSLLLEFVSWHRWRVDEDRMWFQPSDSRNKIRQLYGRCPWSLWSSTDHMAGEKDRRANYCHALWRPAHMPHNTASHWSTQIFSTPDWTNLIVMHWWTNFPANSSEAYGFKPLVMSRDRSSPMHGSGLFLTNCACVLPMTGVWLLVVPA